MFEEESPVYMPAMQHPLLHGGLLQRRETHELLGVVLQRLLHGGLKGLRCQVNISPINLPFIAEQS